MTQVWVSDPRLDSVHQFCSLVCEYRDWVALLAAAPPVRFKDLTISGTTSYLLAVPGVDIKKRGAGCKDGYGYYVAVGAREELDLLKD
ncbi:hypothetical protein JTE90_012593 [Oedothorax gibbosus]|uniref:Uncharacterized protein n=1 Tax=Oedothorax gibbosus TaxID=931172 RepID=A0AAV6V2M2_9ARAC|nr:hypothetical protein JTE90_012593 [Oedothorax gibbosus]